MIDLQTKVFLKSRRYLASRTTLTNVPLVTRSRSSIHAENASGLDSSKLPSPSGASVLVMK